MAVKEKAPLPLVPKSIKAVLYARVSSEEQKRNETIETQQDRASQWSKQRGITFVKVYVDNAVSGAVPFDKRPAGRALLTDAKKELFNTIVVYSISRIGRLASVAHLAKSELEGLDIGIISINEPFDLSTSHGRFTFGVLAEVAELERAMFMERSRDGISRIARQGKWTGGRAPLGYKVGSDGKLVIASEPLQGHEWSEADVVRAIFTWAATDGLPLAEIAERLNEKGIPTPSRMPGREKRIKHTLRGNKWHTSLLSYILHHEAYRGHNTVRRLSTKADAELISQEVPAIISPELWHQAQHALKNRQQWAKRHAKHEYLLSSFLRCGFCGRRLHGHTIGPKEREKALYSCAGLMKQNRSYLVHPCEQKRLPMAWIENLVWQELSGWILHHQDLEAEVREAFTRQEQDRKEWADTLKRARQNLATAGEQRERLLTAYRKGFISDDDLEQQMTDLRAEMKHVEIVAQEMERKLSESPDVGSVVAGIKKTLSAFRTSLKKGTVPFTVKRKITETFVSEVMVRIAKGLDLPETTKVPLRSRLPFRPHEDQKAIPGASREGIRVYQRGNGKQEPQPELIRIDYKFALQEPNNLSQIVSNKNSG